MKVYFTISSLDDNPVYMNLLRVACKSLRQNTTCGLICIYDGNESDITAGILREYNAKIVYHDFPHRDALLKIYNDEYMRKAWGRIIQPKKIVSAFMRFEIPFIETQDDFVIYTDIDCIFAKDINIADFGNLPEYIAAAPEDDMNNWHTFNAGVLLINVRNCRQKFSEIYKLINDGIIVPNGLLDQGYLNWAFAKSFTHLPLEYNWKPYWGQNDNAKIIHLHGMKPLGDVINSGFGMSDLFFTTVFSRNPAAYNGYQFYTNQFLELLGGNHEAWKISHAEYLCQLMADELYAHKNPDRKKYKKYKKLFNIFIGISAILCILLIIALII
jgi:lipopolysaccharide biosynthesis glycosyltransferase